MSRRSFAFALSAFTLMTGALMAAEPGFLAQQAQLAWQERAKPGQTEQAIHLWKLALRAEPANAGLWIDLAKAESRAVRHAANAAQEAQWADEALAASEKAIEKAP